jgi:hypothetical protein
VKSPARHSYDVVECWVIGGSAGRAHRDQIVRSCPNYGGTASVRARSAVSVISTRVNSVHDTAPTCEYVTVLVSADICSPSAPQAAADHARGGAMSAIPRAPPTAPILPNVT